MSSISKWSVVLVLIGAVHLAAAAQARQFRLPADTLLRVRILATLDSKVNRAGDSFPFEVVENVIHDGRTWVRRGTKGRGLLTKVKKAWRFGQNGKLVASFGQIRTTTGQFVTLTLSKKATEVNHQDKLAAGASLLGLVALGPIGLAGGAFVKGEDVVIRRGAELYVATEETIP